MKSLWRRLFPPRCITCRGKLTESYWTIALRKYRLKGLMRFMCESYRMCLPCALQYERQVRTAHIHRS